MKILKNIDENFNIEKNTILALGTFDGLHIAHKQVIEKIVDLAKKNDMLSVVYTFSNHPKEIIPDTKLPKKLITPEKKIKIIKSLGVDILIIVPFDKTQLNIDANYFLQEIIIKKIKAKHIVVGYDFKFGNKGSGTVELLKKNSIKYNYTVDIVEPIKYNSLTISSTIIREFLLNGEVEKANILLDRKYSIRGRVVKGEQIGRKLGFPTINLNMEYEMSVLKPGVYVSETIIDDINYYSITNVGFNPTFTQKDFTVETYILDYNKNLYNTEVKILFDKYIRKEIKFNNINNLIEQINKDVLFTKKFFNIK